MTVIYETFIYFIKCCLYSFKFIIKMKLFLILNYLFQFFLTLTQHTGTMGTVWHPSQTHLWLLIHSYGHIYTFYKFSIFIILRISVFRSHLPNINYEIDYPPIGRIYPVSKYIPILLDLSN